MLSEENLLDERVKALASETSGCESCSPDGNAVECNSELCLHLPAERGLHKPHVFAFPKLVVCLKCGSIRGSLSAEELQSLRDNAGR